MEDQGIMALPQAGMQAPTAQPQAAIDPKNFSPQVFDYARMQPDQFGQDILGGMEAADPALAAEFKQALAGMQLPPEVIDALGDMVDAVLAEPQKYDEIRAQFIESGIPEEILPPTFDAAYFAALNLALDQLSSQQAPVGMAGGGIMTLNPVATELAKMGRGGDRMIAHITPSEARMLRRSGGAGTINPYTGQPEFIKKFAKKLVKSITQPIKTTLKGLGKVVKKIAASPIGRIALTVAAVYFMGPAGLNFASGTLGVANAALATGINAFAGSTLVNLASGQKLGDAVKGGVISGVLAGVGTGFAKGFDATVPTGAPTGATTFDGIRQDPFIESDLVSGQAPPVSEGVVPQINAPNVADLTAGQQALSYDGSGIGQPVANVAAVQAPVVSDAGTMGLGAAPAPSYLGMDLSSAQGAIDPTYGMNLSSTQGAIDPTYGMNLSSAQGTLGGPSYAGMDLSSAQGAAGPSYAGMDLSSTQGATGPSYAGMDLGSAQGAAGPSYAGMDLSSAQGTMGGPSYSGMDLGSAQGAVEGVNPYARAPSVMGYLSEGQYYDAAKQALMPASYSNMELIQSPQYQKYLNAGFTPKEALSMASSDLNPGMFRTYAPAAGVALGAAYLGGAFTPKEPGSPNLAPKETGTDLLRAQPGVYGTTPGGANVTYASLPSGYNYNPMQMLYRPQVTMGNPYGNIYGQRRMFAEGGIASVAPRRYATGGYAKGGIGSMANFPRKTGPINGPGTGTSDDIPAMLSDGEFVMTAKAVRGAGKGSRREGARRMYAMMRKLERNA